MLVLSVVAVATLIGLAMLSTSTLQAQAAGNFEKAATADYLAESAIQTASYYLQRDMARIPASWANTSGYKIKAQNVTVSGVTGSFDVSAVATAITDEYQITAIGRSDGTTPVTRTATAKVRVVRATPTFASGFGSPITTILGRNYFNGGPVLFSSSILGSGILNGGSRSYSSSDFVVPSLLNQISYYGGNIVSGTYTMPNGNVGTPQILASGTLASPASLTALATNPGKVFYYSGNITITGAGVYNGTLIARGNIDLRPPLGSAVTINRVSGFPAIITDGLLSVNSKSLNVNINGVAWLGLGTSWSLIGSTSSNVRINGALLTPAVTLAAAVGTLTVNYTPANNDVLNLTPNIVQPAVGLKLVNWQQ
jgi:hypothetical protein